MFYFKEITLFYYGNSLPSILFAIEIARIDISLEVDEFAT